MRNILFLFIAVFLPLSACSTLGLSDSEDAISPDEVEVNNAPAGQLYNEAKALFDQGQFEAAAEAFQEVERLHPASPLASKSQVMAAFSFYKDGLYDDAIIVTEQFIKLRPAHEDIPYMYYLRAISYYEQIVDIQRDQELTRKAKRALQEVARRFPDNDYARDARIKLDLVQDHLAGKQMEIGRFYLERGKLIAAANRFKNVIEQYQTTSHVPEALHRLTETYLTLGITPEAQKYAAVLGHNYLGSQWYARSYRLLKGDASLPEPEGDASWYDVF